MSQKLLVTQWWQEPFVVLPGGTVPCTSATAEFPWGSNGNNTVICLTYVVFTAKVGKYLSPQCVQNLEGAYKARQFLPYSLKCLRISLSDI